MTLSPVVHEEIAGEVKQFATELNLTDEQKERLKIVLTEDREKLRQYRQDNPNISREEIAEKIAASRSSMRGRVESFLAPEQLAKWETAMAKVKDFLARRAAST